MQVIDSPMIPALAEAMPAIGIENLQKMGTKFVLCANALGIWCLELEARGKGRRRRSRRKLRAQSASRRHDRAGDGDRHRPGRRKPESNTTGNSDPEPAWTPSAAATPDVRP